MFHLIPALIISMCWTPAVGSQWPLYLHTMELGSWLNFCNGLWFLIKGCWLSPWKSTRVALHGFDVPPFFPSGELREKKIFLAGGNIFRFTFFCRFVCLLYALWWIFLGVGKNVRFQHNNALRWYWKLSLSQCDSAEGNVYVAVSLQ